MHNKQVNAMVQLALRLAKRPGIRTTQGLVDLLNRFAQFAKEYADTLSAVDTKGNLAFLLDTGIDRLLQEWSILSRACEQRNEPSPKSLPDSDQQQSVRYNLEKADKLLQTYCKRWHHATPVSSPYLELKTPVAYFEKLYRISRALFAPQIPVISIPLCDYNAPENWQALAHEMGHHIFWNAIELDGFVEVQGKMRKAVADALRVTLCILDLEMATAPQIQRLALWDSWLEEVFADVCGVLFAGPAFALSAQDLAAASVSKLEDLIGEHGERHPSLYLRPLISLQVVREVALRISDGEGYREKLLAWAGMGEAETQRRAPDYEDQLRTQKAAQAQVVSPGRVPAQFDALREALSFDDRWQHFSLAAAHLEHPMAGAPLAELASDVPVVVRTLLFATTWPGDQCLWNLVDYQGRVLTGGEIQDLEKLAWNELPPILPPDRFPPIPEGAADPQSDFGRLLNRFITEVGKIDEEEDEKRRLFWKLLAAISVEADTAADQPHDWASDHGHPAWWSLGIEVKMRHTHSPDGLRVIWDL